MINDYSLATEEQLDAALKDSPHQIICGNPPLAGERTKGWSERMRDQAKGTSTLFKFKTERNQSVLGNASPSKLFARIAGIDVPDFWEGTGL